MKKINKILMISILFVFLASVFPAQAAVPSYFDIEGKIVYDSRLDINAILKPVNLPRNSSWEWYSLNTHVSYLVEGISGLGEYGRSLVFFVAYGTPTTRRLSVRERAGVLNSYKYAYNKLPLTKYEWADVIRIANGTKPLMISEQAEDKAKIEFRKAYGREPILAGDEIAIYIMAYGIRPLKADLKKEAEALKKFQKAYGFTPVYGYHWDVLRALAYSGVK